MKIKIIFMILALGFIYRLFLTEGGNFLFNMDNGRDFVDVREMVEFHKFRLTGPNAAISGLYNGPFWYYLLAIPYVLSGGDPYGAIIMEIILWAIGGFFLLKLVAEFNKWLILPIGLVWVASNYIVLANLYSFNPNPLVLLTPLFIYGLTQYIKFKKGFWIILTYFLAGAFFNFEMNFGIWTVPIIVVSLFLTNKKLFRDRFFWIGMVVFVLTILPQVLFDLKHQFIMSKSVLKFLSENSTTGLSLTKRAQIMGETFYSVFQATMMNHKLLSILLIFLSPLAFKVFLSKKPKNITVLISAIFIMLPFLGYLIIPVTVNAWHLGAPAAASLILTAFILLTCWQINFGGKIIATILSILLISYSLGNISNFFLNDRGKLNMDPSSYKNEIAAIDFVYKYAQGKNFKVYTYLPSVYDYPYQYLIWWYGQKHYGYIPAEYVYLPNKPSYIPSQDKFQGKKDNFSGLIFLIKEPDRNYTRAGWEGDFIKFNWQLVEKQMIGPIEIEIRTE